VWVDVQGQGVSGAAPTHPDHIIRAFVEVLGVVGRTI
jgi:hypothetical protein